jgi:hypothetical protein
LFRADGSDETNPQPHETIFRLARRQGETALGYQGSNETTGQKATRQGTVMIKALSAIAVAAFVAAALTVLPGFAPQVEASTPHVLVKGDRLDLHPVGRNCSEQAWPNFEASCLRAAVTKTSIQQARLVTADRTP